MRHSCQQNDKKDRERILGDRFFHKLSPNFKAKLRKRNPNSPRFESFNITQLSTLTANNSSIMKQPKRSINTCKNSIDSTINKAFKPAAITVERNEKG